MAEQRERLIQSIEVGFRVVKVLEAADGALQLNAIAQRAQMPTSKAYTYLASFVREGLVIQDPITGYYGLGPFAYQLGLSAIRQVNVISVSSTELPALCEKTGFACFLSMWGNRGPSIAVKADAPWQVALSVRVGFVLPMRTAVGYVYLAWRPNQEVLKVAAEQKIFDDKSFDADIATVRKKGFAMTRPVMLDRMGLNAMGMAVPIFDHAGEVAATISLLGPIDRLHETGPHVTLLLDAASRLSTRIGGRSPAGALAAVPQVSEPSGKRTRKKVA